MADTIKYIGLDAAGTGPGGNTDVNLHDSTANGITSTATGPKRGLDVQVLGGDIIIDNATIAVEIDAADGDNIAIKDITGTNALSISVAGAAKVDGSAVTQPISAASLPLPTGASTSALQTAGNASLSSIDSKAPALGQALAAASIPVVLTAAQVSTLTPPAAITGFSTETTLALIKAKTDNLDVALSTRAVTGLTNSELRASAVPVTFSSTLQTYAAATSAQTASATPTDFFTITGSATKTIKIREIRFRGLNTAANGAFFLNVLKRSTANTNGTSVAVTAVPLDSNNAAATATVLAYTVNPTLGTLVGNVCAQVVDLDDITITPAGIEMTVVNFSDLLGQPLTLRGISQVVALSFGGTAITNLTHGSTIIWTEE